MGKTSFASGAESQRLNPFWMDVEPIALGRQGLKAIGEKGGDRKRKHADACVDSAGRKAEILANN